VIRYLAITHGHAELSPGGGERSAYALFDHLRREPDVDALLLARVDAAQIGHAASSRTYDGRQDEIIMLPPPVDPFTLLSKEPARLARMLNEVIALHKPSVVHLQHFVGWGLDIIDIIRRHGIRVVMTLHEFLLICHHQGQMMTTAGKLCHKEAPVACSNCFPDQSAGAFFVRKRMILKHLEGVELFISPSQFLADRFVEWGIDRNKIEIIENPLIEHQLVEASLALPIVPASRVSFGFFGQITPFKGVEVLLKAIDTLPRADRECMMLSIHGKMQPNLPSDLKNEIDRLLQRFSSFVEFRGPYQAPETISLMREVDWIVIPSIWWENSPVVMQEAMIAGRPILCSDLGGLREKAQTAVADIVFRPGSAHDLAKKLSQIIASGTTAKSMSPSLRSIKIQKHRQTVQQLKDIFKDMSTKLI
jgi:glycosyltransferase involved in cell wall biosynthesis